VTLYDHDFVKDPDAVVDFTRYWTAWLADGEAIATSAWVVPTDLTNDLDTHDDDSATIWLSGGTAHHAHVITNTITTSAGRTGTRSWIITIKER
jgi:hypothetical protein